MNLLIDSGNSFIKWVLEKNEIFILGSSCSTKVSGNLQELWNGLDEPDRVIVSNVAGQSIASDIKKAVTGLWQLDTEFVESRESCCGLRNNYRKPKQLGVDRWMAMIAAYQMTQDSVIVVDCGTAVTIDLVNKEGSFVGGVIMPGLHTAYKSLKLDADAIEDISYLNTIANVSALSTQEAVQAGVLFGIAGGIERVIKEHTLEDDMAPTVLITGGDAEKIAVYLTIPVVLQDNLVLQGLRLFADEYRSA